MWHCSAPSLSPLRRAASAGGAALLARGTGSSRRSTPIPLGTAGMEVGCRSAPFLALLEMDVEKGVWRQGESRPRAPGCVPRPATATSAEAGEQVSCAGRKQQGSTRESEPSVQRLPGRRVHPSPPSELARPMCSRGARLQALADGFWASSFPASLGDKDLPHHAHAAHTKPSKVQLLGPT